MNLSIIPGGKEHVEEIVALHALSWQRHYRGVLPDSYLDHEVVEERQTLWNDRFAEDNPNLHLLLARLDDGTLAGFSGTFMNKHTEFGAYIDNLHILEEYQGNGWGRALLNETAALILSRDESSSMYLYVFDENKPAIRFYERMGGQHISTAPIPSPGGVSPQVRLYLWEDPAALL